MQVPYEGGCLCGAVRYRVTEKPKNVAICYWEDCTRAVGSVVSVWAQLPAGHFEFTSGDPARFESSRGVIRTFCPRCGTFLTYHYKNGKQVDVATATLDDPGAFPPNTEGPEGSRPPWMSSLAKKGTEAPNLYATRQSATVETSEDE